MSRPIDPRRRVDVLQAARDVIRQQGYAQARMADIARQAGVATGTVYLYFPSKEALVAALADDHLQRLCACLEATLSQPQPPAVRLAAALQAAFDFAVQEQDVVRLLFLEKGLNAGQSASPAWACLRDCVAGSLRRSMAEGAVKTYDADVLSDLILGLLVWALDACLVHGTGNLASYRETIVHLLQEALLK